MKIRIETNVNGLLKEKNLIVSEDARGSVIVTRHFALLGHCLHERLGELENVALYQRLDDLEQLFHNDGNALVTEKIGNGFKMRCANKSRVLVENGRVCNVERFAAPQVVIGHLRRLVAMHRLTEENVTAFDKTTGRSIVAIVGQEIVVELPEDVERHATVRRQNVVICFAPHGVEIVHGQAPTEQFMRQTVHLE